MRMKEIFVFLLLLTLVLLPGVTSSMNDEKQGSVSITDEYCQVSCYDEEEDATYTVGLSGKVLLQETDPEDEYCSAQIYESIYKDGESLAEPVNVLDIGFDDEQYAFGGYIYHEDTAGEGESVTTRARGFTSVFFDVVQDKSYLWKLLYSGYVTMTQDTETNTITASYIHRINSCPIGTYVEMHAMCDSHGTDWDEIALGCTVYEQGERASGSDNVYGLYDTGDASGIGTYNYYIYCSASD